jgi:hypothetical protein
MKKRVTATDVLLAALLCAAFAGPAAGSWYLHNYQDPISQISTQQEAVYSSLTQVELDGVKQAAVRMTWATGRGLVAPNWTGTVTAAPVSTGDVIREGTVVAEVDGLERIAVATTSPFFRPLAPDSTGRDIKDLNLLLGRLGYRHGEAETWTSSTSAGVVALQRRLGLPPTTPAGFDPGWVVWLPGESLTVGSIELTLGGPAPGPGTQFAAPVATLSEGLLVDQDESSLILDAGVEWSFTTESGETLPVVVDAQGVGRITNLQVLATLVPAGAESLSGRVAYSRPVAATAVPVPAIITGAEGDTCLWLLSDPSREPQPWPVTVIEGDVSASYVSEVPPADAKVLINPAETMADAHC